MDQERLNQVQHMLKENPSDPFLNYAAALEYRKHGDNPKAIELLEGILSHSPDYLATYYQLGKLYEQVDDTGRAKDVYLQGTEIAKQQNDNKARAELDEALMLLDD